MDFRLFFVAARRGGEEQLSDMFFQQLICKGIWKKHLDMVKI
jgi:hypothetical protein